LLRIGKVSEEIGEVWRAYIGAVGQNPRKGFYSDFWHVAEELADVALTAIVAMATVDPAGWERILAETVTTKTTRLLDGQE
jgi:NTP pyrophosphatase (non-canonical NTP hydrolase)